MCSENVLFKLLSGHTKNATLLKILIIEFTVRVYLYAYMHLHAGISVYVYSYLQATTLAFFLFKTFENLIGKTIVSLTIPRLRSITTEDEFTNFYYGHGWFFVVTVCMEGTGCPSMLGCTPTQLPISAWVSDP
jgi:hypothetical protein